MSRTEYVLYYSHGTRGQERIWYASRAPGDGGKDWEVTTDPSKAGRFSFALLQRWVSLRGGTAGWRQLA